MVVARGLPQKLGIVPARPRLAGVVALGLALAVSSLGTVEQYAGTAMSFAYLAAVMLVVPAVLAMLPRVLELLTPRRVAVLAALTFVALVVVFAVVHPRVDAAAGTVGSDRDEDADIATTRLLDGEYPYDATTYLGNRLTHMPGSLLFAAPFVSIGTSAYQNLFWLPVFFIGLWALFGQARVALVLVWGLLALSPAVAREFLTGGDLIANNIYVLLLALLVLRLGRRGGWPLLLAAAVLGIALSSRANFLFVLPLLFAALVQTDGLRRALAAAGTAAAAFLAVTLPFYLYDPDGFTPARTSDKIGQYSDVLPHAQYVIGALAVALVLGLALTRMERAGIALARNAALVQGLFVVAGVILGSAQAGRADFFFLLSGYGLNIVFFAAVAALPLVGRTARPTPAPHP